MIREVPEDASASGYASPGIDRSDDYRRFVSFLGINFVGDAIARVLKIGSFGKVCEVLAECGWLEKDCRNAVCNRWSSKRVTSNAKRVFSV